MPRYTNARQTPIVLSNGRVIATGESFDEEDLVAQSAVRIGLALDTQAAPKDAGVESHERVEGVGIVQHEPTPEQAAAQKAHDDRQKTTNTRRTTSRRKGES